MSKFFKLSAVVCLFSAMLLHCPAQGAEPPALTDAPGPIRGLPRTGTQLLPEAPLTDEELKSFAEAVGNYPMTEGNAVTRATELTQCQKLFLALDQELRNPTRNEALIKAFAAPELLANVVDYAINLMGCTDEALDLHH